MVNDERDERFAGEIGGVLRAGPASTAAARARIMDAVRAEPRPRREGRVAVFGRRIVRHPGLALLAAASIAAFIALGRAVRVEGPVPPIPGAGVQRAATQERAMHAPVVPAAGGPAAGGSAVPVQFVLVDPKARKVSIVGDFNDWDPAATPLDSSKGVWTAEVELPTGPQSYAFVVDGSKWIADPGAPRAPADELSAGYSMIVVGAKQ